MDPLTISGASGLRARMESLEMLANNLANVSTDGFKTDREFYGLYVSPESLDPAGGGMPQTLPVIERHWTDFTQGVLHPTGNPFHLAISGRGFFAVNGSAGRLYTRNGGFQLSATGVLSTAEGYPVRAVGSGTLRASSQSPIEVAPDGVVTQDGQVLGQLELVDFTDTGALAKQGRAYFRADDPRAQPVAATGAAVHQGKLEGSNVTGAEGAVRLIGVMRQFEMLQKAVSIGGEMNRKVVEEVARVGS